MLKQANKILNLFWMGLLTASILSNPALAYTGRDSGIFLYIGSLILKGQIPYRDVWENKGPLVFYLNALALFFSGGSRWGIWALEFIFIFGASLIGYIVVKKIMGVIPALIGALIWVSAASHVLQGGNFSEEYALLFSFSAILFFLKSSAQPQNKFFVFGIGITLGLNILLRPNNISIQMAIAGAFFIAALISKDWRLLIARATQILIGAVLVILPTLAYFYANNALNEMINVVIVFNAQYSAGGGLSRLVEGMTNAIRGIGFPLILFAFLGYLLALAALFKKNAFDSSLSKILLILLIGLPLEALLSGLSGKNYPHYFIGWSLYIGFLWSYVIYWGLERLKLNAEGWAIPLVLILIGLTLTTQTNTWKNYGAMFAREEYRDELIDYIKKNTAPEDTVLVWGFRPIINFVAQRESPASYLPYPLSHVDTPLARHWADEFYAQLTAHPPILILNMIEPADRERIPDLDAEVRKQYKIKWKEVVLAHNYQATLAFIREHYLRVDRVNGVDVYRWKAE